MLAKVERQRAELEANIAKLRKSLRHWQTLEIDYEGLREELLALPNDCSTTVAINAMLGFGPELVDEKELWSLFVQGKGGHRGLQQAVDLITKRADYVSKNVSTLQKQLSDAERKRNALLLAEEPDYRADAGLPFAEITEELDPDGKVLSSKVETRESATPQLIEVLRKVGIRDLVEQDGIVRTIPEPQMTEANSPPQISQQDDIREHRIESASEAAKIENTSPVLKYVHPKASLSSGNGAARTPARTPQSSVSYQAGDDPAQVIGDELAFACQPDDSEEDAALRREMLQYGLGEVGAIVAELDLEEDASDISYEDDEDGFSFDSGINDENDEDEDEDEDDSEDEYGRSKRPLISDSYRKKMEQLEEKLGLVGLQNVGPEPTLPADMKKELNKPTAAEAARKAAIARAEAYSKSAEPDAISSPSEMLRQKKSKKKVAFADSLDIANEPSTAARAILKTDPSSQPSPSAPMSDYITEHSQSTARTDTLPSTLVPPKRVSRFKSSRNTELRTPYFLPPQGETLPPPRELAETSPTNDILSETVIERPTNEQTADLISLREEDFDVALHQQQIVGEYQKLRNRMIHRQGGFVRDGEAANYGEFIAPLPMVDEDTGKVKKISRFKAARLK